MKKMCSLSDYLGGELLVEQGGVHGEEGLIVAVFDSAFAMAMNQNGALLGL
jgi:acyl-coenzyme A thioesterase PaaI-like protein